MGIIDRIWCPHRSEDKKEERVQVDTGIITLVNGDGFF
jgi:hypothetical protein